VTRGRPLRLAAWLLAALAVSACSDTGPVAGAGTRTGRLVSPNGAEGAAVLVLIGGGIGQVTPVGETRVFRGGGEGKVRIVLVDEDGGELAFQVEVADTTAPLVTVVEQVAAPDDALRVGLAAYRVVFGP